MGRPLVWVTAAFAAGILASVRRALDPERLFLVAGAVYALWLLGIALQPERGDTARRPTILAALPVLIIFATLGHLAATLEPVRREATAAAAWDGRGVRLEGLIVAPVEAIDGRQRAVIRILRLEGVAPGVAFTALATLPATPTLRYGDVIATRGTVALPLDGGNPGEPSLRAALQRRGVSALLRVPAHRPVLVRQRGRGNPLVGWTLRLRDRLVRPLLTLPPPYGSVLAGLLFGAQAAGNEEMEEIFLRAGLLHVLVVSGAQVGLLAGAVLVLLTLLRTRPVWRFALAAGVIVLFATMVGWGAAVGRAAVMAIVGLGALVLRRDADGATSLALAALLWLAAHPSALFGLGFQLSFAATAGLMFLSPALTPALRPRWLAQVMGATLGAQIAVTPLLAVVFQRLSLAAFPANLAVLPIVAVLVPAGFLLSLIALAVPAAAAALAPAFYLPTWAIVFLARIFADAPGAQIWLPPISWWQAAAAYLLLFAMARHRPATGPRGPRRWTGLAPWIATLAAVLALGGALPSSLGSPLLTMTVLDVGQGDSILFRGPTGRTMLVDGGGEVATSRRSPQEDDGVGRGTRGPRVDIGIRRVVPALRRLGVRRLELVMLTHPDEDHVGGLPAVLQNFSVDLVLDPGVPHPSPSYGRFLELVRLRRIHHLVAREGQRIDLGGGVVARVLWPRDGGLPLRSDKINNRSIVARIAFGTIALLLTGDIEAETEERLARDGIALGSTVLKVPHHGSRTSTTPAFLDAVRPAVGVISVGRGNLYGHPHTQTLRTLAERGVRVYRTDRDGAVIIRTDGRVVRVETTRGRP